MIVTVESIPFVVQTDASDVAIAVTLTENGHPVAFFPGLPQATNDINSQWKIFAS